MKFISAVFPVILFMFLGCTQIAMSDEYQDNPIVIQVEKQGQEISYKVDGNKVETVNLLDAIGEIFDTRGRHYPVILLIDDSLSINTLWHMDGLIRKVGFGNIRYFIRIIETSGMREIKLGSSAYFSNKSR